MSQRIVTPWLNTNIPGAYVNTTVISNASGLASSGVVLIMGEAAGGPDYSILKLANNFFGPTALTQVRAIYTSGPIVDAFAALSAPSNDPDIKGTASSIYIVKTNKGTQASALVAANVGNYGTFDALNWGVGGNLFSYTITSLDAEITPQVTGDTVPAFGDVLNGATFSIRLNGGAVDLVTLSSSVGSIPAQAAAHAEYATILGMPAGTTIVGGVLDSQTFTAGTYTASSTATLSAAANLNFSGSPTDVFYVQVGSSLTTGAGATITLAGGALAENIYWQVGTSATLGAANTFNGNILANASISIGGGTVNGSMIALTGAVTIGVATNIAAQSAPLLGAASSFAVLGALAVTNTGNTVLTGDLGVAPGTSITGFPPGTYSGSIHRNDAGGGALLNTIAELVAELNVVLPVGIVASVGLSNNVILTETQYTFTVTSANATAGATYTNNGQTFTVLETIAAGTTLQATGSGDPSSSGTLTKITGTGDATIAFSAVSGRMYSSGWGKSFELIDSTPGDLAALGLITGLTVSSQEPGVEVQIINTTTGVNEVLNVFPNIAMSVGYVGTSGTMTIGLVAGVLTLTTTVVGGSGTNLSIPLTQYTTISQLAAFINSQPGYSASASPSAIQLPPSALDQVTAIGIVSSTTDEPGRVKDSAYIFQQVMNTSTALNFIPTAVAGLPEPSILIYLSGGARGATSAADIVNVVAQLAGIQINIIVPLFSQNATKDILAGNTDPSSTYTIDAINELLKSHCIQYSTPTLKRNRMAILSYNDTYIKCKAQAQSLATYHCGLTCQQVTQVNSAGVNTLFLPWYGAAVAAGMQSGGFYKSICNHLANVVSFQDPVGYDSGDPDNVSDALTAGLLVFTQDTNGIPWVSDQTTYGLDTNFVYNSIQAVYLSDILTLDLGQYLKTVIVGKSVADLSAASILSSLQQRFDFYKRTKIVTTSSDAPLGFKDASVQLSAPSVFINVEAKLTTSIYFAAIELALSSVQQSAS
jgi:hypothetical protein